MTAATSWAEYYGATWPTIGQVLDGVTYTDGVEVFVGILDPGAGGVVPDPGDVRWDVDVGDTVGTLWVPPPERVELDYLYDTNRSVAGTLPSNVIPGPTPGDMTRVKVQVVQNGQAVDGAIVTAVLMQRNSAIDTDQQSVSTYRDQAETQAGYAELMLYRATAFTQGDGRYSIEVKHEGKILYTVVAAMPDQAEIFLPILTVPSS